MIFLAAKFDLFIPTYS